MSYMTLPPLPYALSRDDTSHGVDYFTADQMREYAAAALEKQEQEPAARQPLFDEEIAEICIECALVTQSDIYFARCIERAHGIGVAP